MSTFVTPGLKHRAYLITCEATMTRTASLAYPGRAYAKDHVKRGDARRIAIEAAPSLLSWPHLRQAWAAGVLEVENPHGDVYRFAVEPKFEVLIGEPFEDDDGEMVQCAPIWAVEWTAKVLP